MVIVIDFEIMLLILFVINLFSGIAIIASIQFIKNVQCDWNLRPSVIVLLTQELADVIL